MNLYPLPLQTVADQLARLPGLGEKSALRIALTLLRWSEEKTSALGRSILELHERMRVCSECGAISDSDPCSLCADPARSDETLCVVPEWDSLLAMETSGVYKGKYLVLGGLWAPLDGVQPAALQLDLFRKILVQRHVEEVVLALGTTTDAEATASYLKNILDKEFPHIRLYRLAQGIPLGVELKYMDRETLRQSLEFRQQL